MNVLFICSANKDWSRTAEDYFISMYPEINFLSSGTNIKICLQLGTSYLEAEQLIWADVVYVMETKHYTAIKSLFGNKYHS